MQSNTGKLFRTTYRGVTTEIDLGGESVPNGDGLWLRGRTLYVVQNRLNVVAKIQLNRSGTRGELVSRTTDPGFDVPTTIAEYGNRLYLPNARFTTTADPDHAVQRGGASAAPSRQGCQPASVPTVVRRWVARESAT